MTQSTCLTVSELFGLLSNPARRCVLYRLLRSEETRVEEVADRFSEYGGDSVERESDGGREQFSIALVHNHLPRLADHDFVAWDAGSREVARGDAFEEVAPLLESIRSVERESNVEGSVPDTAIKAGAEERVL